MKFFYFIIIFALLQINNSFAQDGYKNEVITDEKDLSKPVNLIALIDKIKLNKERIDLDASFYSALYEESRPIFDPWEKTNRYVFEFNRKIDKYMSIIASTYFKTTPMFLGVVDNLYYNWSLTPVHILYSIMQFDIESIMIIFWRFVLNVSFGGFGAFDVAGEFGLRKPNKSIDQIIVSFGGKRGPYVVTPFFGSSTITNTMEIPLIIAMNLYSPYTNSIGFPFSVSLMYSYLGNNIFAYAVNFTALLIGQRYFYDKAYSILINDGVSVIDYKSERNLYMSITNFSIDKETEYMTKGRFKRERPIKLSHCRRIDDTFNEEEFQLISDENNEQKG